MQSQKDEFRSGKLSTEQRNVSMMLLTQQAWGFGQEVADDAEVGTKVLVRLVFTPFLNHGVCFLTFIATLGMGISVNILVQR